MRPPFSSTPIFRISGRPRPELAPGVTRAPGSRRPHHTGTVKEVQALIEQTTLTYEQISKRTGVAPASISRWMQAGEWKRPLFAPRSMLTVPTPRATAYNRHRRLATRLAALADRYVRELEEASTIDLDRLGQALELARMAKLATMSRTRRRLDAVVWGEPMRPIIELCAVGVDLRRAPREAVDDFLKNRALPPEKDRPPRSRGRSTPRHVREARRHQRMLERE
jgi:transcriptional regulator with XRE-family HTH domain